MGLSNLFEKPAGSSDWVLDGASYAVGSALTLDELVAEEAGGGHTTDASYVVSTDYTGRDLNNDGVVGLAIDAEVSAASNSSIYKAHIGTDEYYLVGSNLSSGTEANPLQLDATQILMEDATTVWAPGSTSTVSNWMALDYQSALAAVTNKLFTDSDPPTHKLNDSVAGDVYFTHTANGFIKTK